ncbi:MAG TPA: thioesterase family protein [Nocardioidaceae bacterium]|nr:thioesterase family protein [Nocardioidaceae bacterium]
MTPPMPQQPPFYVPAGEGRFLSQLTTASPWGPTSQHGSPPSALLGRAIERLDGGADRFVGRITVDLLGPVPVGPLSVEAAVVRPGRNLDLCEATLLDEEGGRAVARASAWRFPTGTSGPCPETAPLPHGPDDGAEQQEPAVWSPGYVQAVEWRWVKGGVAEPGPALVWMRPRVPLVEGEETTPFQALMACVDSASGVSAELDVAEWGFQNPELTVHLLRRPVGDWFCLEAETTLGSASAAVATSAVYDAQGLVARTSQALLTLPRR